jgi:peptidoglycan/LPS O-acetylase OafA/YrhL
LELPIPSAVKVNMPAQEKVKPAAARSKIYFPGLNGLRALAALSVVVVHINQFKKYFGAGQPLFLPKFLLMGNDAVTLFFVLSGFLITYLLYVEHQQTGMISVRNFYIRRILRIWPLYYFIVLIGFVGVALIIQLLQFQGDTQHFIPSFNTIAIYLLFVPNAVGFFAHPSLVLSHLWTIGIEEQFYLMWPPLVRKFIRYPLIALFGIIVFKIIIFHVDSMIVVDKNFPQWFRYFISFLANLRIESMALGGIAAYLWFQQKRMILNILFHPVVEKIILILMLGNVFVFSGENIVYPNDIFLSALYAAFILNIACNPRSTLKLENRYFRALGKFSYGLYMYHPPIIYLTLVGLSYTGLWGTGYFIYNLVLYGVVIAATIGVSAWSYRYFEGWFLALKDRFVTVPTGGS